MSRKVRTTTWDQNATLGRIRGMNLDHFDEDDQLPPSPKMRQLRRRRAYQRKVQPLPRLRFHPSMVSAIRYMRGHDYFSCPEPYSPLHWLVQAGLATRICHEHGEAVYTLTQAGHEVDLWSEP